MVIEKYGKSYPIFGDYVQFYPRLYGQSLACGLLSRWNLVMWSQSSNLSKNVDRGWKQSTIDFRWPLKVSGQPSVSIIAVTYRQLIKKHPCYHAPLVSSILHFRHNLITAVFHNHNPCACIFIQQGSATVLRIMGRVVGAKKLQEGVSSVCCLQDPSNWRIFVGTSSHILQTEIWQCYFMRHRWWKEALERKRCVTSSWSLQVRLVLHMISSFAARECSFEFWRSASPLS